MNIQDEVQKIHHQYGTTEKANYEIQKLFDGELNKKYSEEDLRESFKQSRQAKIFEKGMPPVYESFEDWFSQFKKK